jgi:hypothetical protein
MIKLVRLVETMLTSDSKLRNVYWQVLTQNDVSKAVQIYSRTKFIVAF